MTSEARASTETHERSRAVLISRRAHVLGEEQRVERSHRGCEETGTPQRGGAGEARSATEPTRSAAPATIQGRGRARTVLTTPPSATPATNAAMMPAEARAIIAPGRTPRRRPGGVAAHEGDEQAAGVEEADRVDEAATEARAAETASDPRSSDVFHGGNPSRRSLSVRIIVGRRGRRRQIGAGAGRGHDTATGPRTPVRDPARAWCYEASRSACDDGG